MADIIFGTILIIVVMAFLFTIMSGKFSSRRPGIAMLTAFHDFQPKDKQEAIEVIVERRSGKSWTERGNGFGVGDDGTKK